MGFGMSRSWGEEKNTSTRRDKDKIPVIYVKRKDIGLKTVLRNNMSSRRRWRGILNKRRKRYLPTRKNPDTFTKTRKEDETKVRRKEKRKICYRKEIKEIERLNRRRL